MYAWTKIYKENYFLILPFSFDVLLQAPIWMISWPSYIYLLTSFVQEDELHPFSQT